MRLRPSAPVPEIKIDVVLAVATLIATAHHAVISAGAYRPAHRHHAMGVPTTRRTYAGPIARLQVKSITGQTDPTPARSSSKCLSVSPPPALFPVRRMSRQCVPAGQRRREDMENAHVCQKRSCLSAVSAPRPTQYCGPWQVAAPSHLPPWFQRSRRTRRASLKPLVHSIGGGDGRDIG
jgi:hypothetical protein